MKGIEERWLGWGLGLGQGGGKKEYVMLVKNISCPCCVWACACANATPLRPETTTTHTIICATPPKIVKAAATVPMKAPLIVGIPIAPPTWVLLP